MKWRIGFGLEQLGVAALKRPGLFSFLLLVLIVVSGINVRHLSFDGSVLSVLPDQSEAYSNYEKLNTDYRNFSRDVTVLIESDRLLTSEGLDDLRNLQLEISLADGVAQTVSIFSTPEFDPQTGEPVDWYPDEFTDDADMLRRIEGIIEKYPQSGGLFSIEKRTAVIIVTLVAGIQDDDEKSFLAYRQLREATEAAAPDSFKISFTGLTPIGATILSVLISDQAKLTVVGILLGTAIAFYIFKSVLAALLCALPPILTALWSFSLFSLFEVPINYLTTVLPTLALILAFADGIFLYFRWQTLCSENDDLLGNLEEAVRKVGPASSLTSITTAIAFLSFSYADSTALKEFAYIGAGAVSLAFVAVIIGLPLGIYWAIHFGLAKPGRARRPLFQRVGRYARSVSLGAPIKLAMIGLALVVAFGYIQRNVTADYNLIHYLPHDSDIRYGEELANDIIGGRSLLLLSVPFAEEGGFSSELNTNRLSEVEAVISEQFGAMRVYSANRVLQTVETKAARSRITELASEASDSAKSDFISHNEDAALVSVRLVSDMPVAAIRAETDRLSKSLEVLPFGDEIIISGFPILISVEFTKLINQLRASLMIAILLGILFIGFATRSPFITIAAISPNLLPIFFVMVFLYVAGGTINLSEVVALTIAFGIAIDNAVHLINVYDAELRTGKENRHALSAAIEEVGPALTAGTVIICVSTLVTQISALPVVPLLGQLMISTLIVALLSNLLLLPANILTLERIVEKLFGKKT